MKNEVEAIFADDLKRLRSFTKDCRPDMHEPDEQSITAEFGPKYQKLELDSRRYKVTFDNAFTNAPLIDGERRYSDMGFWLVNTETQQREWFNLADIVALARRA